ncbi:MAG: M23 family metallopeptidase [Bacilli bacterium]|nr:M23 family metallopeptidase [Bacilli bacterium]
MIIFVLLILSFYNFNNGTAGNNKDNIINIELVFNDFEGEYQQGDYIEIIIENVFDRDLKLVSDIADQVNNQLYKDGNKLFAYIPIGLAKEVGDYTIEIYNNEEIVKSGVIKIVEGDFVIQNLTIKQSIVDNTQTKEAYQEYRDAVAKARSYNFKERFYEDAFIMPIDGRITTEFGVKRYINGSIIPTRHYGIDIANDKGTPVKAAASGKVVFADYLTTSGNYIVIDHGRGLFSYYAHLDSLNTNLMDFVDQGDIIGYVGSTGFSTGPHLHFNITFMETSISPWLFINKPGD